MVRNLTIDEIQNLVDQGLRRTGLSQHKASMLATGKRDALRAIGYGKMPSVDRWQAICHVLGIPFHTGFAPEDGQQDIMWSQLRNGVLSPADPCKLEGLTGSSVWDVVEIADQACQPFWQEGDRLCFDREDPLANIPERLIGLWCLIAHEKHSGEPEQLLGRCRRADKQDQGLINIEDPSGQPTRTNIQPVEIRPLRMVLPKV